MDFQIFKTLIETVFVDRRSVLDVAPDKYAGHVTGGRTIYNLILQMCVYWHFFLAPLWFVVHVLHLVIKFHLLSSINAFLHLASFLIVATVELPRLFMAMSGNLHENVPLLLGFWLLSSLIQFPLEFFMAVYAKWLIMLPAEMTLDWFMLGFTGCELFCGFYVIKMAATRLNLSQTSPTSRSSSAGTNNAASKSKRSSIASISASLDSGHATAGSSSGTNLKQRVSQEDHGSQKDQESASDTGTRQTSVSD